MAVDPPAESIKVGWQPVAGTLDRPSIIWNDFPQCKCLVCYSEFRGVLALIILCGVCSEKDWEQQLLEEGR
jgi:hypothetical protein